MRASVNAMRRMRSTWTPPTVSVLNTRSGALTCAARIPSRWYASTSVSYTHLCPVLSSDRASMKEILKDSVLYFDPQSADDISNSIFQIIDSSELRRDLIRKGSVNVARFSWEQSADQVNNIINACR